MPPVLMYCTAACPYCIAAERLLAAKGSLRQQLLDDKDPYQPL